MVDRTDVGNILLGPAFNPRVLDIPTPQLLLDKGVPDGILRLVSLSARKRVELGDAAGADGALNMAVYIATCLRLRDSGGDDGRGTPVMTTIDATALADQDFELQKTLSELVRPFLGLDVVQAVTDAKNG